MGEKSLATAVHGSNSSHSPKERELTVSALELTEFYLVIQAINSCGQCFWPGDTSGWLSDSPLSPLNLLYVVRPERGSENPPKTHLRLSIR